jgi:O-acetyl-ADP-ribose deacetylase (regulator of RNase III)
MKLILRDRNQAMIDAWKVHFKNIPEVEIGCGDIFDVPADAIVSPANSFGFMNGGIDLVYSRRFGLELSERLQKQLASRHDGELPVGEAIFTPINLAHEPYKWLICAPTMRVPTDIDGTVNAYLAMRATLRLVKKYNENAVQHARSETIRWEKEVEPQFITSVLCPGLGTAIGRMPYNVAAFQMREAYRIVIENQPLSFRDIAGSYCYHDAMRRGLPYKEPEAVVGEN